MSVTRFLGAMVSLPLVVAGIAYGQDYPNRAFRIVTGSAGGGSDFVSRLIAQALTDSLGQPVVVDNRGNFSVDVAAKAAPDGYNLLVNGSSQWIGPLIQKLSYDPVRDFAPVTLAERAPNALVSHPSVPARSVKELIALAKARPGELNYASGSTGGASHLAGELFKAMAGVNIVNIPYKSAAPQMADLISGQVQLTFGSATVVLPHLKLGRIKALGVTSAAPSELFPGLPTVAATGLPGYEATGMTGVFTPAKTPTPMINRLNQEIVRFLKTAEAKQKLLNTGSEAVGSSSEELAAIIKADMARMGKVIKDAGIKAD